MTTATDLPRRDVLLAAASLVFGGVAFVGRAASATPEAAMKLLGEFAGGKAPLAGRVTLDMPEIAENGSTVPLTVTVESPMTAQDHVETIHLVAAGNPEAEVAVFHLTPANGRAQVSTRIRLAQSQTVIAAARMSDGLVYLGRTEVKVTIGGCAG